MTDTEIEADVPPGIVRLDCERDRLKSGLGALAGESSQPQHPQSARVINTAAKEIGERRVRGIDLCIRKANPLVAFNSLSS